MISHASLVVNRRVFLARQVESVKVSSSWTCTWQTDAANLPPVKLYHSGQLSHKCECHRHACTGMGDPDTATTALDQDWSALNQRLRDNGFAGIVLQHQPQTAAYQSPDCYTHAQHDYHAHSPSIEALYAAFDSVLTQYDRRAHLVQELLAATDMARERESRVDAVLDRLRK